MSNGEYGNGPERAPKLSLILCTRNDSYQGNSLWRLETALNYLGKTAADAGRLDEVEVIVSDWGSETPVRDVIALTSNAARLVRFLWIPPEVARAEQKDSPFPEVLALNAAARRAKGEYIGRVDQDTLVSPHFLETFFWLMEKRRLLVPLESAVMISNRREIPYRFARRCPPFSVVDRYLRWFSRYLPLPLWKRPPHLFYEVAVGILVFHRDIWQECGGFDESFIYMDFMEIDMILRLASRYQVIDLGEHVNHALYHLGHEHPHRSRDANRAGRRTNPWHTIDDMPEEFAPSGPGWGLAEYDLAVLPPQADAPQTAGSVPELRSRWPTFFAVLLLSTAETLVDFVNSRLHRLFWGSLRQLKRLLVRLGLVRLGPFESSPE
jgi:hypothetical protein